MGNKVTVSGLVATTPRYLVTADGLRICSFRFASAGDVGETAEHKGDNDFPNWYTVNGFDVIADNMVASINKGDRLIVSGVLSIRDWASQGGSGTTVEIQAQHIGHDMLFGKSTFERNVPNFG